MRYPGPLPATRFSTWSPKGCLGCHQLGMRLGMPRWLEAVGWGLLAGSALLAGAAFGYLSRVPRKVIASVMAFGAGVLLSSVAFELIGKAHARGGLAPAAIGAVVGAVLYTGCNVVLARHGARHRKRSGDQQPTEAQQGGSGLALALGALLDGIPESIVIGTSLLGGGTISLVTVTAVFISNVPEGLSSAAGMRNAGRSRRYVFGLWAGIALISALAAVAGYVLLAGAPAALLAGITALAGGAILAMIADTMIPEAFENAHLLIGLITVGGFLVAFALSQMT
jgi:ZIP family zinc transporter